MHQLSLFEVNEGVVDTDVVHHCSDCVYFGPPRCAFHEQLHKPYHPLPTEGLTCAAKIHKEVT